MNKKIIQKFVVLKKDVDMRLDIFLAEKLAITRSKSQKLIRDLLVTVNDNNKPSKYVLVKGDNVVLFETIKQAVPEVPVIYEDNDILIIDKPAGITTHPAPGETDITISELFNNKYIGNNETKRENIVHRLDKGTSGVMVLAKNESSRDSLIKQFATRGVNKKYIALVSGKISPKSGVIDIPLARDLVSKNRIAPADEGKDAKTLFTVDRYYKGYTLLSANPKTGRTHQIRVHLSAIGHPLYGDVRYGARDKDAKRIFLHSAELSFIHPTTGERVKYTSELPLELQSITSKLEIE